MRAFLLQIDDSVSVHLYIIAGRSSASGGGGGGWSAQWAGCQSEARNPRRFLESQKKEKVRSSTPATSFTWARAVHAMSLKTSRHRSEGGAPFGYTFRGGPILA